VDGVRLVDVQGLTTFTTTVAPTRSIFATFGYTINFQNPANGSLSVSRASTDLMSGSIVHAGEILTIEMTPADGYELDADHTVISGLAVVDAEAGTYMVTASRTSPPSITVAFSARIPAPQTYLVTVINGSGGGSYQAGDTVTVTADPPADGWRFRAWTGEGVTFTSPNSANTAFAMPAGAVTVTATYEAIPPQTYPVTVINGSGGGSYQAGVTVTVTADSPAADWRFKAWTGDGVTFTSPNSAETAFTMPARAVTVTATYEAIPPQTYPVTVINGSGGGSYQAGVTVPVTADSPADGQQFKAWTGEGVTFTSPNSAETAFTMPAGAVTVTATYEAIPAPPSGAYSITPDTAAFTAVYGYDANAPARIFTLANTGAESLTGLSASVSGEFEIAEGLSANELAPGAEVAVSVRPLSGLNAGTYTGILTVAGADGTELNANLTFTVSPRPVTGGAINLPAPVRGAAPAATVTTGDFTAAVTWNPAARASFAAGAVYTATITLPFDQNYDFGGLTAGSFTISGAASVTYDPNTRTITAVFPRTASVSSSGGGGGSLTVEEEEVPLADLPGAVSYIYGADRIETAVAIAKAGWTSAETVILAPGDGDHIIDALTVSSLSGQEDAPILLVMNNSIRESVYAEIERLGAGKAYIVGSLGQGVADQLKARLPQAEIIVLQGANRIETAKLINARITNPQGTFVVGYSAIADAVSAASFAAANGYVIQIAASNAVFSGDVSLGGYVLGGPTLVREVSGLTRIYGADRYGTNQSMRDSLTFMYDNVYFANGVTLVDALTGSALAAKSRAVILLTPRNDPTNLNLGPVTPETKIFGFGGPAV
jgi:hypothetical protein